MAKNDSKSNPQPVTIERHLTGCGRKVFTEGNSATTGTCAGIAGHSGKHIVIKPR